MFKKIFISIIILGFYYLIPVTANLEQHVDEYYDNLHQLKELNLTKQQLEGNLANLNKSELKTNELIGNVDNNINVFNSEIDTFEKILQENKQKKNEIKRNIQVINILNNKESFFLIGASLGIITGLWITCLPLVLLWRK
ncbi:MAG: hypothetical protein FIB07_14415 [Candidatus Methanoperedens sp.]|nr:hypothetical protein [Candidatus Methanoperedens sp.]